MKCHTCDSNGIHMGLAIICSCVHMAHMNTSSDVYRCMFASLHLVNQALQQPCVIVEREVDLCGFLFMYCIWFMSCQNCYMQQENVNTKELAKCRQLTQYGHVKLIKLADDQWLSQSGVVLSQRAKDVLFKTSVQWQPSKKLLGTSIGPWTQ